MTTPVRTLVQRTPRWFGTDADGGIARSIEAARRWCERAPRHARELWSLPDPTALGSWGALGATPDQVVEKALHDRDRVDLPATTIEQRGRLLGFYPDESFSDGAAARVSEGFFDDHNTPAWDTWVGYFVDYVPEASIKLERYLVAYVPSYLVAAAQLAIDVNPEQCIGWLGSRAFGALPLFNGWV
jgi:hypothetical protein